jgi:hypothetical protein
MKTLKPLNAQPIKLRDIKKRKGQEWERVSIFQSPRFIAVAKVTLDSRFHTETKTRQYASIRAFCLLPSAFCYIFQSEKVSLKAVSYYREILLDEE